MPRPTITAHDYDTLSIEGALFAAEWLGTLADLRAGEQEPAGYGIPKGLILRDELSRFWRIAEAQWTETSPKAEKRPELARTFVQTLLRDVFGFTDLTAVEPRQVHGRTFPIGLEALGGRVPVVVAPWGTGLDTTDRSLGDGTRRRSAMGLVQEWLNASDGTLWGLCTDGRTLRLVRDNASLTRPAYVEWDLARCFEERRYADFCAAWLLLHASRFGKAGEPAPECALERWRTASKDEGIKARSTLRAGVERALVALGAGALRHPANDALRSALTQGSLDALGLQAELLRTIYRIIFLLVTEERGLLHPKDADPAAVQLYADGYALRRLRDRALRRREHDRHDDCWRALQVVLRGLVAGEPALALPAFGGLFAPGQCPVLDAAQLDNAAVLDAIRHLGWTTDKQAGTLERVNWRDMGPEELGSIYESLLELVPRVDVAARTFTYGSAAGNERKLTGSYYTPDDLVQLLLDQALEPVVEPLLDEPDAEQRLLGLSVLDPACGSGHFLLGAGRRLAGHLARVRAGGTPDAAQYATALRDVTSRCLYGVDKNAMAIELARIALWLEAVTPDAPLAFVDHHLVHGDALLGVRDLRVLELGIPPTAFDERSGDDRATARRFKALNKQARDSWAKERASGQLSQQFDGAGWQAALTAVEAMPDRTPSEVAAKAAAYAQVLAQDAGGVRLACDAYVAAFLLPKTPANEAVVPTTGTLRNLLAGVQVSAVMAKAVTTAARAEPCLHWPLAFAPVIGRGGFDLVIGNPPWEKIKLQEKEFFAERAPEIANARNAAARERAIDGLANAPKGTPERVLYETFLRTRGSTEAVSAYVRVPEQEGGRCPLTGSGDVNLYAVFAETALRLVGPHGRVGMVLPSGIATDAGTAPFFAHVSNGKLVSLFDFENREALFAGVHRSYKFCLLVLGQSERASFAFFLTRVAQVTDARRRFTLTPADVRRLNPNTRTCPTFRSQADAELTAKIYAKVPVLWDETREDGNPWGISFGTLFHMSNDSHLFHTEPGEGLVPLYEAKMVHHYDHRWASYRASGDADGAEDVSVEAKADVTFEPQPRYWVARDAVEAKLEGLGWQAPWLLGFRDITNATNERTVIASFVPRVGAGNTLPLLLCEPSLGVARIICLNAVLGSLVLDFSARHKVGGTHLNFFLAKQLPVLAPHQLDDELVRAVVQRAVPLLVTSNSLVPLLEQAVESAGFVDQRTRPGVPFRFDPEERAVLRAELDALIAHAYGINRDDLRFILDPADVYGPDYPTETFRVLRDKESRAYGEYRTRRLVLEAWDRLVGTA